MNIDNCNILCYNITLLTKGEIEWNYPKKLWKY